MARESTTQGGRAAEVGFNATEQNLGIATTLGNWQSAGDERLFKIIVPPEFADSLNLQQHTRDWLETEAPTQEENLNGRATINRALTAKDEAIDSPQRVVLYMDSTEIPAHSRQEQSAYDAHFESTCYHPLLLFNGEGDCVAAKLRPSKMHSAKDWEELLPAEIERQQNWGKEVVFRADAGLAKPEIYKALEARSVKYAIRFPANGNEERDIDE